MRRQPKPSKIIQAIRAGHWPPDEVFDLLLPEPQRSVSGQYWTPVEVIKMVVEWLQEFEAKSVVDIGAGAGKLCILGALASDLRWIGIEQRSNLVDVARELADSFQLRERATFIVGAFGQIEVPEADAYYMFNPFGENLFEPVYQLDAKVELSEEQYKRDLEATFQMLRRAKPGTILITYNGFGGNIPSNYQEIRVERGLRNILRAWRKTTKPEKDPPHSANAL
jgi:predicted RNA methylase